MVCDCHGEPMYWRKDSRYKAGGFWFCSIKKRIRSRDRYHRMTGLQYNRVKLLNRRAAALYRRRKRRETHGSLPREGHQ